MHELFALVLRGRDLSRAGDLFSLENDELLGHRKRNDGVGSEGVSPILAEIEKICDSPAYVFNEHDQAVVEICVTRVSSFLRDSSDIDVSSAAIVSLLSACLRHDLGGGESGGGGVGTGATKSPHANIASDVIACVFVNPYAKDAIARVIPLAVEFLRADNPDLRSNMVSYLTLAAVDHAPLLSLSLSQIVDAVCRSHDGRSGSRGSGEDSLLKLMPRLYEHNPVAVHAAVPRLAPLFDALGAENQVLLAQLLLIVARDAPEALAPQTETLLAALASLASLTASSGNDVAATPSVAFDLLLEALTEVAKLNARFLATNFKLVEAAVFNANPAAMKRFAVVLAEIGKVGEAEAALSLPLLQLMLPKTKGEALIGILEAFFVICLHYPEFLQSVIKDAIKYGEAPSHVPSTARKIVTQLRQLFASSPSSSLQLVAFSPSENGGGTYFASCSSHASSPFASKTASAAALNSRATSVTSATLLMQNSGNAAGTPPMAIAGPQPPSLLCGASAHVGGTESAIAPPATLPVQLPTHNPFLHLSRHQSRESASSSFSNELDVQAASVRRSNHLVNSLHAVHGCSHAPQVCTCVVAPPMRPPSSSAVTAAPAASNHNVKRLSGFLPNGTSPAIPRPHSRYSNLNGTAAPTPAAFVSAPVGSTSVTTALEDALSAHRENQLRLSTYLNRRDVPGPDADGTPSSDSVSDAVGGETPSPQKRLSFGQEAKLSLTRQPVPSSRAIRTPSLSPSESSLPEANTAQHRLSQVEKLGVGALNKIGSHHSGIDHTLQTHGHHHTLPGISHNHEGFPGKERHTLHPPRTEMMGITTKNGSKTSRGTLDAQQHGQRHHYNQHVTSMGTTGVYRPHTAAPTIGRGGAGGASSSSLPKTMVRISSSDCSTAGMVNDDSGLETRISTSYEDPETRPQSPTRKSSNVPSMSTSPNTQASAETDDTPDVVQQFCSKHLDKIKNYIEELTRRVPIPVKCSIEESKHRKFAKLHFMCFGKGELCLFNRNYLTMKTTRSREWTHIMFLALQARSPSALSQNEPPVSALKACWDCLKSDSRDTFAQIVTSSFPQLKEQEALLQELRLSRYFDSFEYKTDFWGCWSCNNPERIAKLLREDGQPAMEGQLKEKKSKWFIFRRWKMRYFTLSGGMISFSTKKAMEDASVYHHSGVTATIYRHSTSSDGSGGVSSSAGAIVPPPPPPPIYYAPGAAAEVVQEAIPVRNISSVKALKKKGRPSIPKSFEIFANNKSYVLKAKDSQSAEEWIQCLQIAVAQTQRQNGETALSGSGGGGTIGTAASASTSGRPGGTPLVGNSSAVPGILAGALPSGHTPEPPPPPSSARHLRQMRFDAAKTLKGSTGGTINGDDSDARKLVNTSIIKTKMTTMTLNDNR